MKEKISPIEIAKLALQIPIYLVRALGREALDYLDKPPEKRVIQPAAIQFIRTGGEDE